MLIIADSNSSFSQFGKALSVRHRELDEIELSGNIFTQSWSSGYLYVLVLHYQYTVLLWSKRTDETDYP